MRSVVSLLSVVVGRRALLVPLKFARVRRSAVAVEFALVAVYYFTVLLFVVEGGIFYLKVDLLDLASERAARLIMINNVSTAPASASAFITDIVNNSNGALSAGDIAVSVQMAAPISGPQAHPTGGFQSLLPASFTAATYQYVPGSCVLTTNVATGKTTAGTCTGSCTYPATLGLADQGYQSTTSGVTNLNQIYTCSAGQNILVQVQFTDSTLTQLIAKFFGPQIATLAFQAEPSNT